MTFPERIRTCLSCLALLTTACGTVNQGPVERIRPVGGDVREVAAWMSGSYSSAAQAAKDPQFRSVVLHIAPIWIDRPDARWFYVEQAMTDSQDRPYRQRVYRLSDSTVGVESMVFELPGDPLVHAGAWKSPRPLDQLLPSMLVPKAGCAVKLTRAESGEWTGGTDGTGCPSARQGAAYTTSEVTLTATELRSWDRGYDAQGKQVWGSTAGPYVFVKERSR